MTPTDETEKEPAVLLKGPRDWFDLLDQWREGRGSVLHLGKPSRPATIRFLVAEGIEAEEENAALKARVAELEAENAKLRASVAKAKPRQRKGRRA